MYQFTVHLVGFGAEVPESLGTKKHRGLPRIALRSRVRGPLY